MLKQRVMLALAACALALPGCISAPAVQHPDYGPRLEAAGPAAAQSSLNLNGTAYQATLWINGLAFEGFLARQDASMGWRFQLAGRQAEKVKLAGSKVERTWAVSLDLSKPGLTADPNGLYTGKASVSLAYDMRGFDAAAFDLVQDMRGWGADFDYRNIRGWISRDEYEASRLAQRWESEAFTLYIGGLKEGGVGYSKTLGHTLAGLAQTSELYLSHRLIYDLPGTEETFIYTLEGDPNEQAAELCLTQYRGKNRKTLPLEPVGKLDFSGVWNALEENDILLEFTAA